jgi:hypothetical protein
MARTSSLSEKPISDKPRRLADCLNPTGEKKVHSLIDKVYKQKNLELAWDKVRRNKGTGGIDGQSITEFESNSGEYLARLADGRILSLLDSIMKAGYVAEGKKTPDVTRCAARRRVFTPS